MNNQLHLNYEGLSVQASGDAATILAVCLGIAVIVIVAKGVAS